MIGLYILLTITAVVRRTVQSRGLTSLSLLILFQKLTNNSPLKMKTSGILDKSLRILGQQM